MKTISLKEVESYLLTLFKNRPWTPVQLITTEAQAKLFSDAVKEIIAKYESQDKSKKH